MSDPAQDDIPQAVAQAPGRFSLQWVWLIPVLALLIGVAIGGKALLSAGPTITIRFANAEGLEAGKTRIKFKNVDIGEVKAISLSSDGTGVEVTAAMSKGAQKLLVDDTRFWVVRARFAGSGVTGLSTLLSGAYIGIDAGKSDESRRDFVGLETQPGVTADEPGREFVLHSNDLGSIDVGSPLYYRRVPVGKVTGTTLDADGKGVSLRVFVSSPHERFVTENTRFWQASGLDVQFDGTGLKLQTQSLISVVLGGIAFGVPEVGRPGPQAPAERHFRLFDNQAGAMRRSDDEVTILLAYFRESLRGLAPGAQVDFRGVVVGEVRTIDVSWDREAREFRFPVEIALYRDRLGSKVSAAIERAQLDPQEFLKRSIERGLSAQLRSSNLLTGQRYVALDFFKDHPAGKAAHKGKNGTPANGATAMLEIPTVPGTLEDLEATVTGIAKKIDQLPFAEIASDLRTALQSLDTTLKKADTMIGRVDGSLAALTPELQAAVADTRQTMRSAQNLLASDAPTQQDLREALRDVARAAQSLRELTDYLQRRPESLLRGKPAEPAEGTARP